MLWLLLYLVFTITFSFSLLFSIRRPVPVPFVGVRAEPFIKRKELRKLPAATKLYVKKRFLSSEARLFSVFLKKK